MESGEERAEWSLCEVGWRQNPGKPCPAPSPGPSVQGLRTSVPVTTLLYGSQIQDFLPTTLAVAVRQLPGQVLKPRLVHGGGGGGVSVFRPCQSLSFFGDACLSLASKVRPKKWANPKEAFPDQFVTAKATWQRLWSSSAFQQGCGLG